MITLLLNVLVIWYRLSSNITGIQFINEILLSKLCWVTAQAWLPIAVGRVLEVCMGVYSAVRQRSLHQCQETPSMFSIAVYYWLQEELTRTVNCIHLPAPYPGPPPGSLWRLMARALRAWPCGRLQSCACAREAVSSGLIVINNGGINVYTHRIVHLLDHCVSVNFFYIFIHE